MAVILRQNKKMLENLKMAKRVFMKNKRTSSFFFIFM